MVVLLVRCCVVKWYDEMKCCDVVHGGCVVWYDVVYGCCLVWYDVVHGSCVIWCRDDVLKYDNGEHGYFLEVDLGYPTALHDTHADYPLAPENLKVSVDMVSEFSKNIYSLYHEGKHFRD